MMKYALAIAAGSTAAYFAPKLIGDYVEGESSLPGSKQAGEFSSKNPKIALAVLGGGVGALAAFMVVR